jgi:hypothetical protein
MLGAVLAANLVAARVAKRIRARDHHQRRRMGARSGSLLITPSAPKD